MSEYDEQGVDTTNSNEDLELDNLLDDTEDVEATIDVRQTPEFKQVHARAKKAEEELKELKRNLEKPVQATQQTQPTNGLTAEEVEVRILKTQKVPDDNIAYLKKIATLNGSTLIEAMEDEMYEGYVAKKEAKEKSEKAQLGVSRGSNMVRREKDFKSPDLTDADHKELWKRQNG